MAEKQESIGAMWQGTTKKGDPFLSGKITVNGVEVEFIAFKNNFKEGKQPDFKIFPKSKPSSQPVVKQEEDDGETLPF